MQCFMCVVYGSLSVCQHALAAESRVLRADSFFQWDFSCFGGATVARMDAPSSAHVSGLLGSVSGTHKVRLCTSLA